jgi:hypothetical protein
MRQLPGQKYVNFALARLAKVTTRVEVPGCTNGVENDAKLSGVATQFGADP